METALQVDHGDGPTATNPDTGLRRGPWTVEEDVLLANYISMHGEGRWNSLARTAGLRRTGKSCRLRWLNYLRPDVRRGNLTAEEQLVILELHSRWGNRWSKIAQHLPGRTDNEIKNYWRTRVQKHAKHLQLDVNSSQFRDLVRYLWMPRLVERIRASSSPGSESVGATCGVPSLVDSSQEICGWSSTDDSSMSESMMTHITPREMMLQQSRITSEFADRASFEGVGLEWNGGVSPSTVEEPWASRDGYVEQPCAPIDGGDVTAESFWSMDSHELWSLQGFQEGIGNFVNY